MTTAALVTVAAGARLADFAYPPRPAPAELVALGYAGVVVYITDDDVHPKQPEPAELPTYHAAGLAVLLVWETYATRCLRGRLAGDLDGELAAVRCHDRGYPTDLPILVACDTDVRADLAASIAYVEAFADACQPWPIGVYGGSPILSALPPGMSDIGWLPAARSWSPGVDLDQLPARIAQDATAFPWAHVRQFLSTTTPAGADIDPNIVLRPITAWLPHDEPPPLPPEEPMPSTAVIAHLSGHANKWLLGAGTPVHLEGGLYAHYVALGVPEVEVELHPQFLDSIGADRAALVPL